MTAPTVDRDPSLASPASLLEHPPSRPDAIVGAYLAAAKRHLAARARWTMFGWLVAIAIAGVGITSSPMVSGQDASDVVCATLLFAGPYAFVGLVLAFRARRRRLRQCARVIRDGLAFPAEVVESVDSFTTSRHVVEWRESGRPARVRLDLGVPRLGIRRSVVVVTHREVPGCVLCDEGRVFFGKVLAAR